jgi:hypothetical protein
MNPNNLIRNSLSLQLNYPRTIAPALRDETPSS